MLFFTASGDGTVDLSITGPGSAAGSGQGTVTRQVIGSSAGTYVATYSTDGYAHIDWKTPNGACK